MKTYAVWAKSEKKLIAAMKLLGITNYIIGDPDSTVAEVDLTETQVEALKKNQSITEVSEL